MKSGFYYITIIFLLSACGVSKSLNDRPDLSGFNPNIAAPDILTDTFVQSGNNQLRQNAYGLWELYVEGDPLERGLMTGALTQTLIQKQERIFFDKIEEFVPSKKKQKLLRKFLAWYNRKLYLCIPNEYKAEIYGLSQFASDKYDHIADNYLRSLYLHGAHDIGHALKDLALVGCTSFAVWGDKSEDGSLIVGRNFDFYVGDEFAEDKIVSFVAPTTGYNFMSVTWGGMIGVVSGMNDQGLTVTINAGKSSIPLRAKTPISILCREILQYASNIDEAVRIAKKRSVFVSESICVASANDHKAVTIEVSPKKFGIYEAPHFSQLICANHFQSDAYQKDKKNKVQIKESHSQYRYERMAELLDAYPKISPQIAADILRDRKGLHDKDIGYGNEKALNQLLAHHAIIFKPAQRQVWVSANPYQLGEFVAYDLDTVFEQVRQGKPSVALYEKDLLIEADSFLYTKSYEHYEEFRNLRRKLLEQIESETTISSDCLKHFIATNPEFWEVYFITGKYYFEHKNYRAALENFTAALTKEVTTIPDKEAIEKYISKTKRKIK